MEEERKSRRAFCVTYLLLLAFSVGAFLSLTHSLTRSRDPPATTANYSSAPTPRTKLQPRDEATHNQAFCASAGGRTEVRHAYTYPTGQSYIRVDCETADAVYEGGLDNKRNSLNSVQQALFSAHLTGKAPVVVIYDTDGQIGKYEHRIQVACKAAGVRYLVWTLPPEE